MAKKSLVIGGYSVKELRKLTVIAIVNICISCKKYIGMLAAPKKFKQNFVDLSLNMTAKMLFVLSLSTSCIENELCKKHMAVPGAICKHCFAKDTVEHYKSLSENLHKNLEFFTKKHSYFEFKPIAIEIVETLIKNDTHLFRLESFGDIANSIHCANYIMLCSQIAEYAESKNYSVSIAWWTKNYDLFSSAIKCLNPLMKNKILNNFRSITNVILSSLFIGLEVPVAAVERVESVLGMKVKVFTVYNIPENDKRVTCGARSCTLCQRCYTKKDYTEYVIEALK